MIKVKSVTRTCIACPSQWEGIDENEEDFYVRYRWGVLSVIMDGEIIYHTCYGDSLDGYMETNEMKELLSNYLDFDNATFIDETEEN